MLKRFNCDLEGMGDICPEDDGAVGGLYRVRALTGVGAHSELPDPQEGVEGDQ